MMITSNKHDKINLRVVQETLLIPLYCRLQIMIVRQDIQGLMLAMILIQ